MLNQYINNEVIFNGILINPSNYLGFNIGLQNCQIILGTGFFLGYLFIGITLLNYFVTKLK